MPSVTTISPDIPPFPSSQVFDILPPIYDLITRLPSSTPLSTTFTTPQTSASDPLELKDLPHAALPVKQKIQKAKAAVLSLPDVEQTIEEQEDDIRGLEWRIKKLRNVVEELGRRAAEGNAKVKVDGTD